MKGLLDFLQSASNTVAGNVAGPVDLIAAGLNKVGVPVGNAPVGGTEWMRQKGLWRDVEQSPASVAGETFGLLGPMLTVAKAPQIAKGLLQMQENAMAPRTLHPETGAIVWHGSPHKFDKFDSSKIGTGEGAQAYGHGLYFAESDEVAKGYQTTLASPRNRVMDRQGVYIEPSPIGDGKYRLATTGELGKMRGTVGDATQGITDYEYPSLASAMKAAKKQGLLSKDSRPVLNAVGEDGKYVPISKAADVEELLGYEPQYAQFIASDPGHLYKVDLPDEAIAKMLDWDKPLSQQAPEVRMLAKDLGISEQEVGAKFYQALANQARDGAIARGQNAGTTLGASQAAASDDLRTFGIPGIRYLDGGSRGAGSGTSNFVVFPGNEGLLTILERNGQALR